MKTNVFRPSLAGGAMSDLGIYPIEAALFLFGKPLSVQGSSVLCEVGEESPIDISGAVLFDYGDKVVQVSYSKAVTTEVPCSVYGDAGALLWDDVAAPHSMRLITAQGTTQLEQPPLSLPRDHEVCNMEFEIADFIDACKTHTWPELANEITLTALQISEALRHDAGMSFM